MIPASKVEDNFPRLLSYIQEGIVLLDREGAVQYASPSTARLLGTSPDVLAGQPLVNFVHPDDQRTTRRKMEILLATSNTTDTVVCRSIPVDGASRWIEGNAINLLHEPGIQAILISFRDVSERHTIEEALRLSDQRLRAVLNSAPIVLFALDRNGTYTLSLGRELEVLGMKPGEAVGKNVFDLYRDHPELAQQLREALAGERSQWIGQVAGRYFDTRATVEYDTQGNVSGLIGVATNVTERMRAYASLRESERRFRGTFNQAAVGIAHMDTDGRWVRVNQKLCEITGFSERELLTQNFREMSHPADADSIDQTMQDMLDGRVQTVRRERRTRHKSGHYIWVHLTVSIVRDTRDRPRFFIVVMEDISQRMRIQHDRDNLLRREQSARAAAEAASQAKDQFLAIVSHELRTPLTPILAGVGLLKRNTKIPPDAQMVLDMIRRNAELEARLIDDLLDLTRITNGNLELAFESVDLHDLINGAIEIHRADLQTKNITLDVDLAAQRHALHGDPARLQQVFWKLLGNAIKFTNNDGRVTISSANEGDDLLVTVTDSGIGIEATEMHRLFNAFEQGERSLSRRYGGLGVGLTICRALVELHGGSLSAVSEGHNQGTHFVVRLPLHTAGAAVAAADNASAPAVRILLVEDNPDSQQLLRRLLSSEGHTVQTASDISEARHLARTHAFDLLLCDIGLPDGSGWELMGEFQQQYGFPGIALSGFGTEDDIRKSRDAGFAAHVVKPVNLQQLQATIQQVLAAPAK